MTDLGALARLPPSAERWQELVDALSRFEGAALHRALEEARPVTAWPPRLRAVSASSPWLAGVFEGARDPRLALVGWASVARANDYGYMDHHLREAQMMGTVVELARLLDPDFDPPDVVLVAENTITYASGCGGGSRFERRGDATRGVQFDDLATEHSADMANDGSWVPYGLADGCLLTIHRHDCIGSTWTLTATGPTPAVFDLATRWGELTT